MSAPATMVVTTPTALIRKYFLSDMKKPGAVLEELKKLTDGDKTELSRDIAKHYGGYHEAVEGGAERYYVPQGALS